MQSEMCKDFEEIFFSVCLEQARVDNQRVVVMTKWKNARLAGQISIFP
jgi:hypothetical protein